MRANGRGGKGAGGWQAARRLASAPCGFRGDALVAGRAPAAPLSAACPPLAPRTCARSPTHACQRKRERGRGSTRRRRRGRPAGAASFLRAEGFLASVCRAPVAAAAAAARPGLARRGLGLFVRPSWWGKRGECGGGEGRRGQSERGGCKTGLPWPTPDLGPGGPVSRPVSALVERRRRHSSHGGWRSSAARGARGGLSHSRAAVDEHGLRSRFCRPPARFPPVSPLPSVLTAVSTSSAA